MPDDTPSEHWVERLFDKLLKFFGPILLAYIAVLGTRNTIKVDSVEAKQVEAAETSQARSDSADAKAAAAEAKARDDAKATATNLYGTWKYLDGVAVSAEEVAKALDAKRTYEEFVRKNNIKK